MILSIGPYDTPVLNLFSDHRFMTDIAEDNIGAEEIAKAKTAAVKIMQQNGFQEELRMLKNKVMVDRGKCKKLRLFLDEKEIIRFHSRVEFTPIKAPHKAPI